MHGSCAWHCTDVELILVSSGKMSEMHLIVCEVKLEGQKRIVPESLGQKLEVVCSHFVLGLGQ